MAAATAVPMEVVVAEMAAAAVAATNWGERAGESSPFLFCVTINS